MTMKTLTTIATMVLLSLALMGCYQSGSETAPPAAVPLPPPPLVGSVDSGKIYFESNCSTCHSLGTDYTPPHFGASNLALKQDMIATNMGDYDPATQLMTAFINVPRQRVLDLQVYIASKS